MKKFFRYSAILLIGAVATSVLSSCSDDDNTVSNGLSDGDKLLQEVLSTNVDNTINPTYKALADSTQMLYEQLGTIRKASTTNGVTQNMVNKACELFIGARANYEKSEAFLMGAAADFSIDPHIDSWPLDLTALYNLLVKSPSLVKALDSDDGANIANSNLGQSLLGFHGIEFILFRDGNPRSALELNANGRDSYNKNGLNFSSCSGEYEMIYAYAVCGDLRNSVYRLETSWNENAPKDHINKMKDLEWSYTLTSGNSYGYNMRNAGAAGSTYSSVKNAMSAILVGDGGAVGISDEVGNVKIYNPTMGKDVSYIESPYSWNSITDFTHNIQSIESVWKGGILGNRNSSASLEAYFKKYSPEINTKVENAITNASTKIQAIDHPFVNYVNSNTDNWNKSKAATAACKDLSDALTEANSFIQSTSK